MTEDEHRTGMTVAAAAEALKGVAIDSGADETLLRAVGLLMRRRVDGPCLHNQPRLAPWSGPNGTPERGLCVQCGDWVPL